MFDIDDDAMYLAVGITTFTFGALFLIEKFYLNLFSNSMELECEDYTVKDSNKEEYIS